MEPHCYSFTKKTPLGYEAAIDAVIEALSTGKERG